VPSLVAGFQRKQGSWERDRIRIMKGSRFRMSSLGMNVLGMPVRPVGPVGRCVSSADTSLSLSLSLAPVAPRF
jgi:hypothetical protein